MTKHENNELRYYSALKTIKAFSSLERLRRDAEKQYGLSYEEALEMAYDNMQIVAANAIRGERAPQVVPIKQESV